MRFDRSKFQSTSQRGLTLVELLVAISVMAFVAVLGWRGLDSITRARASLNQDLEQTRGLQLAFAQMQTDCMNVVNSAEIDGRAPLQVDPARITLIRRTQPEAQPGALQLVTYRLRDGLLTREESPPTRDLTRLEQYVQLVQFPAPSSIPQSSTLQSSIPQSSTQPLSQSRVRLQSGVQAMDLRVWADDGRGWRSLNNLDSNMPTSRSALMNPQAGTTATQIIWSGLEVALRLPGRQASLTKIFLLGSV